MRKICFSVRIMRPILRQKYNKYKYAIFAFATVFICTLVILMVPLSAFCNVHVVVWKGLEYTGLIETKFTVCVCVWGGGGRGLGWEV